MKSEIDFGGLIDLIPYVLLLAGVGVLHLAGWVLWGLWLVFCMVA